MLIQFTSFIIRAHPHIDDDKSFLNMGSSFTEGKYKIVKIPKGGSYQEAKVVASIPIKNKLYPSYYHTFGLTENYYIFIEQSLAISIPHVITSTTSKALKYYPEMKTIFNLICRKTGNIIPMKFQSESFVFFHIINSFEENDKILVDICCYPNGEILEAIFADKGGNGIAYSEARRYTLPFNESMDKEQVIEITGEILSTESPDLPRINYDSFNGKSYRYFYSVSFKQLTEVVDSRLMKFDIKTRTCIMWSLEHHWVSEPVFVPDPEGVDEDDGVVISAVLDRKDDKKGFLLILDGKSFKELARCHFETPLSCIPSDFHGHFFSSQ